VRRRSTFTQREGVELRRLITEKQIADRDRQKTLRARMRAIGFYITDFVTDQRGFTVSDFDDLVARGVILLLDNGETQRPTARAPESTPAEPEPSKNSAAAREHARGRRDQAARLYQPEKVDLLLIAEAPPSALDRYFYFPDVHEQDSLFRYVCRALLGHEPTREGKADLLAELRDRGVYLIDLQQDPRDRTPLSEFVRELVVRCKSLDPGWIILIKASVFDTAYATLAESGLPVSSVRVPFPGSGQQNRFLEAFARALEERPASRPLERIDPHSQLAGLRASPSGNRDQA
jgi:hypothetical protein